MHVLLHREVDASPTPPLPQSPAHIGLCMSHLDLASTAPKEAWGASAGREARTRRRASSAIHSGARPTVGSLGVFVWEERDCNAVRLSSPEKLLTYIQEIISSTGRLLPPTRRGRTLPSDTLDPARAVYVHMM